MTNRDMLRENIAATRDPITREGGPAARGASPADLELYCHGCGHLDAKPPPTASPWPPCSATCGTTKPMASDRKPGPLYQAAPRRGPQPGLGQPLRRRGLLPSRPARGPTRADRRSPDELTPEWFRLGLTAESSISAGGHGHPLRLCSCRDAQPAPPSRKGGPGRQGKRREVLSRPSSVGGPNPGGLPTHVKADPLRTSLSARLRHGDGLTNELIVRRPSSSSSDGPVASGREAGCHHIVRDGR